jgi:hypothetical protein
MGKYSEVFVGIDTAKKKHAVAVADGGRDGEVLYFGEIDSAPVTVERVLKKMAGKYEKLGSATKPGRRATSSPAALSCARTRSLTASWTESGTQTDVNSPARNNRASVTASRRFVLIRSPGFLGINDGATTLHS